MDDGSFSKIVLRTNYILRFDEQYTVAWFKHEISEMYTLKWYVLNYWDG